LRRHGRTRARKEDAVVDTLIIWLIAHPLQGVAILAGFSIAAGLLLIPRATILTGDNHPRC
jgi:hypothetical protein